MVPGEDGSREFYSCDGLNPIPPSPYAREDNFLLAFCKIRK